MKIKNFDKRVLKQLETHVFTFLSFAMLSFLSCDLAICALYCSIFISEIRSEKYINFATVFFISVFFDAYTSRFMGVSAIPLTIFFVASKRLRSILPNAQLIVRIYCFFMLLCVCEFFHSLLILALTMNLNLTERLSKISLATLILSIFYIGEIVFLKVKNWYAR
jgi:hypothetical protein